MTDILIIYGAPAAGKTTLVNYLRQKYNLMVLELDEEIVKENNGEWPESPDFRNSIIVPKVLKRVSELKKMIFVTSGINEAFIKKIQNMNGKVALLYLSKEDLLARNKKRIQEDALSDTTDQIIMNLEDQEHLKQSVTFDYVFNANQPVNQIADNVLQILKG